MLAWAGAPRPALVVAPVSPLGDHCSDLREDWQPSLCQPWSRGPAALLLRRVCPENTPSVFPGPGQGCHFLPSRPEQGAEVASQAQRAPPRLVGLALPVALAVRSGPSCPLWSGAVWVRGRGTGREAQGSAQHPAGPLWGRQQGPELAPPRAVWPGAMAVPGSLRGAAPPGVTAPWPWNPVPATHRFCWRGCPSP